MVEQHGATKEDHHDPLSEDEVESLASYELVAPLQHYNQWNRISDLSCFNETTTDTVRPLPTQNHVSNEKNVSREHKGSYSTSDDEQLLTHELFDDASDRSETQERVPALLSDSIGDSTGSSGEDHYVGLDKNVPQSKRLRRSTLVSQNCRLDPSWFAKRGLMSANSLKKYKRETKLQGRTSADSVDSTIVTSASVLEADHGTVEISGDLNELDKRAEQSDLSGSVCLSDGIEHVTEIFVKSLTSSSDSDRRAVFAKLLLNEQEANVVNDMSKRLTQAIEAKKDLEIDDRSLGSCDLLVPMEDNVEDHQRLLSDLSLSCFEVIDTCLNNEPHRQTEDLTCMSTDNAVNNTVEGFELSYLSKSTSKLCKVIEEEGSTGLSDTSGIEGQEQLREENDRSFETCELHAPIETIKECLPCIVPDAQRSYIASRTAEDFERSYPSISTGTLCMVIKESSTVSAGTTIEAITAAPKRILKQIEMPILSIQENNQPNTHMQTLHGRHENVNSDTNIKSSKQFQIKPIHSVNKENNDGVFGLSKTQVQTQEKVELPQDKCKQTSVLVNKTKSLLDEADCHLSMAMLALLYRKLREMSLLGHVSVKLRDIDVNSYQAISRQKEMKRRGLMTPEEESKGLLDRTLTSAFIVRTVLDEYQMFKESTDLLSLNPIDQVTADYDAR